MVAYRIFVLTEKDRIASEIQAACASDHDALARAEATLEGRYAAEVWQGERLVGRLGGELELGR